VVAQGRSSTSICEVAAVWPVMNELEEEVVGDGVSDEEGLDCLACSSDGDSELESSGEEVY